MKDWSLYVSKQLSPKRYAHVVGVAHTAATLALRFGVDEQKAVTAAWLHDIYRELDYIALSRLAIEVCVEVPQSDVVTWHGPIAAARLACDFEIFDEEIKEAIACHTLGCTGMREVSQILYVADAIEPSRSYPGVSELRAAAECSLPFAVANVADASIMFLVKRHLPVALQTVAMRNQFWQRIDEMK